MTKLLQNNIQIKTFDQKVPLLLDTLAQPVTKLGQKHTNTLKTYEKRARAKYLGNALVLELVKLDSPLKKSYWNTWHCSNIILQDGKKLTSTYCNNRWCPVCNRIRTAKLIKSYLPDLNKMVEPQFVTLTIVSIKGKDLQSAIEGMTKEIIRIKDLFKNRRSFRINGIRKIEVTYNPVTDEYHPHFHIVLDGRNVGKELINEWLSRYTDANRGAQDIRDADENSMLELFKYTTKLTTKNGIIKEGDKTVIEVNPEALDTIYRALYKKRTFQSMGWVKQVSEDIDEVDAQIVEDVDEDVEVWKWEQEASDWVSGAGELLTGCDACERYELKVNTSTRVSNTSTRVSNTS